MAAKKKTIDQITAADLGFDANDVGAAGSAQVVTEMNPVPARESGEIVEDDGDGYLKIVELLEQVKVI
jgi:electron transfer flavoprotein beta subunit